MFSKAGEIMILELSQNEAEMLMMHLSEESFQVEELSKLETGIDRENLHNEAQMMIDIFNRIKRLLMEK